MVLDSGKGNGLFSFEVAEVLQDHFFGRSTLANVMCNFLFIATSVVVASFVKSMYQAFSFVGATTANWTPAFATPYRRQHHMSRAT